MKAKLSPEWFYEVNSLFPEGSDGVMLIKDAREIIELNLGKFSK